MYSKIQNKIAMQVQFKYAQFKTFWESYEITKSVNLWWFLSAAN